MGAKQFFSDPNKLRLALMAAQTAGNAALGTNIELPTAQISQMASTVMANSSHLKARGGELLNNVKEAAGDKGTIQDAMSMKRELIKEKRMQSRTGAQLGPGGALATPTISSSPKTTPEPEGKKPADKSGPDAVASDKERANFFKRQLNKAKQKAKKKKKAAGKTKDGAQAKTKGVASSPMSIFLLTLSIAALKDAIDLITTLFTVGLFGTILNVGVTIALGAILIFQGSSLKSTKKIAKWGISMIAEFIPIISLLPAWTIAVVMERTGLDKKMMPKQLPKKK